MSITKRRLELVEWVENLQETFLDEGISVPVARHILRTLPYQVHKFVRVDSEQRPRIPLHEVQILVQLRFAITSICIARLEDPELELVYYRDNFGTPDAIFGNLDAIWHGATELRDDSSIYSGLHVDGFDDLELEPIFTPDTGEVGLRPSKLSDAVEPFDEYLLGSDYWHFWRDWYQGFLDGKPLDWELQRRVALIPDEDWEKGPEHIAKLIEDIRAQFVLEKRLEALEVEKQIWEKRARLGVGGNNPPEPLEDDRIVQEIIWTPIEDLKAETQSEAPDKSRIQEAVSKLGAALIAIGKWPFGKLDKAADEFAKSLGKWGGGACAGWLALNSDKIAEVVKAAQAWLFTML